MNSEPKLPTMKNQTEIGTSTAHGAGDEAEDEAGRDHAEVDDRHVLEPRASSVVVKTM